MPTTLTKPESHRTAEAGAPSGAGGSHTSRKRFRRRQYLLDWRSQLPGSLFAITAAVVFVVLLNLSSHYLSAWFVDSIVEVLPEMEGTLNHGIQRLPKIVMLVASVAFVAGVFMISIVRSHRTVGPIRKICSIMREVERGNYRIRVSLRQKDNLGEVATGLNRVVEALERRTRQDAAALEGLAAAAEGLNPAKQGRELSAALRRLAHEKKRAVAAEELPRI
ncbi:MAG: HAMP domain-containing protein [Candidatus Krumholzibacteriia bacterium]